MITKRLRMRTRPFQPFFQAANDLLSMALPFYKKVEAEKLLYDFAKSPRTNDSNSWRLEKSLSIGSFITKYMGLEAFANFTYIEFGKRSANELPDEIFAEFDNIKRKLKKQEFGDWPLRPRIVLLAPLCTGPIIFPEEVFDFNSAEWKEFKELIEIRNSFIHASEQHINVIATMARPGYWLARDDSSVNFWPLTGVSKDHRTFNYQDAKNLGGIIDYIVKCVSDILYGRNFARYMNEEKWDMIG